MVGALLGLAFGQIATSVFPDVSGSQTLYALAGLGAVAAAVLGAPISTTLIVFELTGDWQTGLAVMVAVSLSTAVASRLVDRSFFLTQLDLIIFFFFIIFLFFLVSLVLNATHCFTSSIPV